MRHAGFPHRVTTPVRPSLSARAFDPQVARKLGIVAAHLLDEALSVLALEERLECVSERVGLGWSGNR